MIDPPPNAGTNGCGGGHRNERGYQVMHPPLRVRVDGQVSGVSSGKLMRNRRPG